MSTWVVLCPGPSASAALAQRVRHLPLVAVGCAYQLAPWAAIISATDAAWWRTYTAAKALPARKFSMLRVQDVEQVQLEWSPVAVNSGVLGLECAKRAGATRILLLGADMHGTHFFGPYANGLRNTKPHQRAQHLKQYGEWARRNRRLEVLNCTPGSALECFKMASLDACIPEPATPGFAAA